MTHQELLAKIETRIADFCEDETDFCDVCSPWKALRAVVELHNASPEGRYEKSICVGCSFTETGHLVFYPCRIIQAIEKELL